MSDLVEKLRSELGDAGVLTGADAEEKAQGGWSHLGTPLAVVRPASTEETSKALKLCHAAGQGVVAWGGKTGLVEGGNADGMFALSMERMNKVEEIDTVSGTMTVQAGTILEAACDAVEAKGFFFPLDLGARGSATIGGNISTNAGGNRVLRYGMMREMVLGLEVVLADGTVLSAMNHMLKNNAGYDLKQMFIGTEGTLGVVTRAVVRLRPAPSSQDVAFVGVSEFDAMPKLLRHMEVALGGTLSAFEVMWEDFYNLVTRAPALGKPPLASTHPYYVLVESLGGHQEEDSARFEAALMAAMEEGIEWDSPTAMIFGHLGDGNLHVIVGVGDGEQEARRRVEEIVYSPLRDIGGSVSAEHGIGLEKRPYLGWSRTPEEVALMHTLKATLDPKGILNPGKVLDPGLRAAAE